MNSNNRNKSFTKKVERRAKLEKLTAAANHTVQVNAYLDRDTKIKSRNKNGTKRSTEKKRKRNEKAGLTNSSNSSIKEDIKNNNSMKKIDEIDKSHNVKNFKKRKTATSDDDSVFMDEP